MTTYHPLTVTRVDRLLNGSATSVWLDVPPHLTSEYAWKPGQHLPIRLTIGGETVERSYSISSAVHRNDPLRITVKRVDGGLVSNWIADTLTASSTLDAASPRGTFTVDAHETQRRTIYLVAAGSGITPLYAMASSVLRDEPDSQVFLIYGNHDARSVLLSDEIDELVAAYPRRFAVAHVWGSTWSSWTSPFAKGRIDGSVLDRFIDKYPPYAQDAHYFLCGPGTMNRDVAGALLNLDVPRERIHSENYGGGAALWDDEEGVAAKISAVFRDTTHAVDADAGSTVLAALLAAGVDAPRGCEAGVCGTCTATLAGGTVHQRQAMALSAADARAGKILPCQAIATSPTVELRYDAG